MARVDYRVRPPSAGSWGSHPKTAKRRLICCCCCCCCCILPPLIFLIVFLAGVSGPLQAMQESGRGLEVCAVTLCSDAGASCPESTSPPDTTIRMLIDFRFYNPTIITANLLSADFAITLDGQTEVTPGGSADASVAAGALIACALPDEASLPSKDWGTVSVYCEFAEHNAPAEQLNTDPSIGVMANGHVGVHAVVPFEQAVSMRVKVDHEMLKIFEQRAAGSDTSDADADDGSQVPTPTLPSPRMLQQADATPRSRPGAYDSASFPPLITAQSPRGNGRAQNAHRLLRQPAYYYRPADCADYFGDMAKAAGEAALYTVQVCGGASLASIQADNGAACAAYIEVPGL